jgi:hypothetical protein
VDLKNALVIDKVSAILLITTFEENASKMSEEDAATVADDMAYYHFQAEEYLSKAGIPVFTLVDSSLVFKRNDGKYYRLDRDSVKYDMVIWNGKDLPLVTGSAGFQDTLKKYIGEFIKK